MPFFLRVRSTVPSECGEKRRNGEEQHLPFLGRARSPQRHHTGVRDQVFWKGILLLCLRPLASSGFCFVFLKITVYGSFRKKTQRYWFCVHTFPCVRLSLLNVLCSPCIELCLSATLTAGTANILNKMKDPCCALLSNQVFVAFF